MAHPGGRPLKFKSSEDMQVKIDAWIESCWEDRISAKGEVITDSTGEPMRHQVTPYTVSGLALALDCEPRTIINYETKDEFFPIIKRAKNMVLNNLETGALSGKYNPAAAIFNMKANFGMQDKLTIDTNVSGSITLNDTDLGDMSAEELEALAKVRRKYAGND